MNRGYHCGFVGCAFIGLPSVMFNVDIAMTGGVVRPLCRPHKEAVEAEGVKTYPLEATLCAIARRAEERRAATAAEAAAKKAAERERTLRFLSGTLRAPVAEIIRHNHGKTASRATKRAWRGGNLSDVEIAFGRRIATGY